MDPQYYVTTLTNAFTKLGPLVLYMVVGFFLFIKLPFWILSKMVKTNRTPFGDQLSHVKLEEYDAFIKRINDQTTHTQQERPKKESKKQQAPLEPKVKLTPEEKIFQLSPGQVLSKSDLKRKYHELLKIHHPDKVSSLAPEYKKIAEIKTKEINSAYNRLKKKAA